jgi:hypothetical protein
MHCRLLAPRAGGCTSTSLTQGAAARAEPTTSKTPTTLATVVARPTRSAAASNRASPREHRGGTSARTDTIWVHAPGPSIPRAARFQPEQQFARPIRALGRAALLLPPPSDRRRPPTLEQQLLCRPPQATQNRTIPLPRSLVSVPTPPHYPVLSPSSFTSLSFHNGAIQRGGGGDVDGCILARLFFCG